MRDPGVCLKPKIETCSHDFARSKPRCVLKKKKKEEEEEEERGESCREEQLSERGRSHHAMKLSRKTVKIKHPSLEYDGEAEEEVGGSLHAVLAIAVRDLGEAIREAHWRRRGSNRAEHRVATPRETGRRGDGETGRRGDGETGSDQAEHRVATPGETHGIKIAREMATNSDSSPSPRMPWSRSA